MRTGKEGFGGEEEGCAEGGSVGGIFYNCTANVCQ